MTQQDLLPTNALKRDDRTGDAAALRTTEEAIFCEGGCACGAVRYRVTSRPMIVHACHCRLCQRQTGSSNAVNALIEADRVIVQSGDIEEALYDTPSGRGQRIARCASCRVALWSNYLINNHGRHIRFLRVGTLDDAGLMPPDVHIHTATKLPWYVIEGGAFAVEVFYQQKVTWSEDSQRRLKELSERIGAPLR
jgi:hypothetical protein